VIIKSVNADDATSDKVNMADQIDLAGSPGNFFTVYNRAFVFCKTDTDLSRLFQCFPYLSAVVLYNAGLTFHRLAVTEGSSRKYEKALEFYCQCKKMLDSNVAAGLHLMELDVLVMALANNMGYIYSHFFQLDESKHCLERMITCFFTFSSKVLLTRDEYVFFYMNILLLVNRRPVLAPAA
jgi:hypothetical protein